MKRPGDDELLSMLGQAMIEKLQKEEGRDQVIASIGEKHDISDDSGAESAQGLLDGLSPDLAAEYEAIIAHATPAKDKQLVRKAIAAVKERESKAENSSAHEVVDLSERRARAKQLTRRGFMGGILAVAAAAAAVILVPRNDVTPLPGYSLEVMTGVKDLRSSNGEKRDTVHLFEPGSIFEVQLIPEKPIFDELEARVFLKGSAGLTPLSVPLTHSASGAIRIRGGLDSDVDIPAGKHLLLIAIGRKSDLPSEVELEREIGKNSLESKRPWGTLLKTSILVLEGAGEK